MAFLDSAPSSPKLSDATFRDIGAGVSDIFSGFADLDKAAGAAAEAQQYGLAATYAGQEAQYSQMSTDIQEAQKQRELNLSLGRTTAQVAGAGFAASGSALDILRSSAAQGAIAKAVTNEQGLITTAGYREQQQSYEAMQTAAQKAESGDTLAAIGSFGGGALQIAASLATLA
jgi:hypothetical protein